MRGFEFSPRLESGFPSTFRMLVLQSVVVSATQGVITGSADDYAVQLYAHGKNQNTVVPQFLRICHSYTVFLISKKFSKFFFRKRQCCQHCWQNVFTRREMMKNSSLPILNASHDTNAKEAMTMTVTKLLSGFMAPSPTGQYRPWQLHSIRGCSAFNNTVIKPFPQA